MGAHGTNNKQQAVCSTHRDIWWPARTHQQDHDNNITNIRPSGTVPMSTHKTHPSNTVCAPSGKKTLPSQVWDLLKSCLCQSLDLETGVSYFALDLLITAHLCTRSPAADSALRPPCHTHRKHCTTALIRLKEGTET